MCGVSWVREAYVWGISGNVWGIWVMCLCISRQFIGFVLSNSRKLVIVYCQRFLYGVF